MLLYLFQSEETLQFYTIKQSDIFTINNNNNNMHSCTISWQCSVWWGGAIVCQMAFNSVVHLHHPNPSKTTEDLSTTLHEYDIPLIFDRTSSGHHYGIASFKRYEIFWRCKDFLLQYWREIFITMHACMQSPPIAKIVPHCSNNNSTVYLFG